MTVLLSELDTKPTLDEVLEHHGVKGMHWGVRRGAEIFKNAKTNANNRTIATRQRRITKSPFRKVPGFQKYQKSQIKELKASNARIAKGQLKIKDILDHHSQTTIFDIIAVANKPTALTR